MNSRQTIRGFGKRAAIAFYLITILAFTASAQQVQPQDQGKLYGDPSFVGEPIKLDVVNADIRDILSLITDHYGINFVIDKSVKSVPVTVKVAEVPWNIALDSILRSQELAIQVNGPILRVADSRTLATEGEILRQAKDTQLDASPLYTEFIRLNYARALGSINRGSSTSGTTTGSGGTQGSSAGTAGGGGEGLLPIVKRRLSRRGSIEVDGRSNSLVITDVRENIDAIKQLVAILDQPEPQVEIEARIVVATRSFSRDIGIQLAAIVTGPRGSGANGGTLPGEGTATNGFPNASTGVQPNNDLLSKIPNTIVGLTTGVFGTAQISALISAGEQKGQAKIIATPRVTTLNNRKAKIESGTKIPITTIQPGAAAGGAVVATTEYVDVPLKLEITPQITDVGTVVLDVLAENASTATIVSGVAPAINNQTMETQVTVPDGGTTVIGGVLFDDERESQDRTPGLARIPLFGNLFKRKGVQRNTNEILFFITPRIQRPDFAVTPGSSGTRPSATIVQPVPLGNPTSNSDQATPTPTPGPTLPLLPVVPPVEKPAPAAPDKP